MGLIKGRRFQSLLKKINNSGYNLVDDKQKVPTGNFPIYVGKDLEKYVIPIAYLSSKAMQDLLNKFADEIQGVEPIILPCSVHVFEAVLDLVKAERKNCRL